MVLAQELPETRIKFGERQFGLTTNRTIFDITRQAAKKHLDTSKTSRGERVGLIHSSRGDSE